MDINYFALIWPSVLGSLVDHLSWIGGAAVGLGVLWSPPLRALSTRVLSSRNRVAHLREREEWRAQLDAALERNADLELRLLKADRLVAAASERAREVSSRSRDGRIPTPV